MSMVGDFVCFFGKVIGQLNSLELVFRCVGWIGAAEWAWRGGAGGRGCGSLPVYHLQVREAGDNSATGTQSTFQCAMCTYRVNLFSAKKSMR